MPDLLGRGQALVPEQVQVLVLDLLQARLARQLHLPEVKRTGRAPGGKIPT